MHNKTPPHPIRINYYIIISLLIPALLALVISCNINQDTASNEDLTTPLPPSINDNYPPDNSKGISVKSIPFDWSIQGLSNATYNIFFSTVNPPNEEIASNLTGTSYTHTPTTTLREDTTYYWKIVAVSENKEYESKIYNFVTEKPLTLIGYLVKSRASAPVVGSTVTIRKADSPEKPVLATTTSDADGKFSFDNIKNEKYIVEAKKEGRATAKATFTVANNTPPILNMQQFSVVSSALTDLSPASIEVEEIKDNQIITSTDPIMMKVVATDNMPFVSFSSRALLQIAIANAGSDFHIHKSSNFVADNKNQADVLYEFKPTDFPSGFMYIVIICYDANNNLSLLYVPIINKIKSTTPITIVPPGNDKNTLVQIEPVTVSDFINIYGISENTNASINIMVAKNNMNGVLIYRSNEAQGTYEYIGASSYNRTIYIDDIAKPYYFFKDRLPSLSDNHTYYYKLKYYYYTSTGMSTSNYSRSIIAPLLPRFELELTSPTNNYVYQNVPTRLDFTWKAKYDRTKISSLPSADNIENFHRKEKLKIYIKATNESYYTNSQTPSGTSTESVSHTLNFLNPNPGNKQHPLPVSGKQYYWTVESILEYKHQYKDDNDNPIIAITARSYPSMANNNFVSTANNGLFYFTVK